MGTHAWDAARVAAALLRDAVEVHYQPIVVLPARQVVGFEALARLRDLDGTLVPPAAFIGVAEESGQISALGHAVLRKAVTEASRWRSARSALATATVSVNIASAQLDRPRIVEEILAVLDEQGLPGTALVLEVTESMAASPVARSVIERLSSHGIRIAIDDFGTGFATLETLRSIPAHVLKLDRTFVAGVTRQGADRAIVRVVADLADTLGMSVVAEGVETAEQAAALLRLGCPVMQGFLFARPRADALVAAAEPAAAGLPNGGTPVLEGRDAWPLELEESVLSAARMLAGDDSVARGAVHAVTVALARTAGLDPRTVRVAGRMALVHDIARLRVDGRLPAVLELDERLVCLADDRPASSCNTECSLVRTAVAAVRQCVALDAGLGSGAVVLGLLTEAEARRPASPEVAALLDVVAQTPPTIVPFTELLEDLDRRRMGRRGMEERMRSVFGITRVLASSRDTNELMRVALEEARQIVGAASASVERWERDLNQLRCLVNVGDLGPSEETFPEDEVYLLADYEQARRTMLTGVPYLHRVDDPAADEDEVALTTALGKRSTAAVPIYVDGRIWGQLWFATDHGEPPFEARDIEMLTGVATLMGGVVVQAENLRAVDRMAFEDPLTGVGNRRLVDDVLARLAGRGEEVAVALVDLDRLKEINDSQGHAAGDAAIQRVADCLTEAVLPWSGATIGRLGSDELCVVLPGGTTARARAVLTEALDALALDDGLTASVGVASATGDWAPRDVLTCADEDLYSAKRRVHAADRRTARARSVAAGPESGTGPRPACWPAAARVADGR